MSVGDQKASSETAACARQPSESMIENGIPSPEIVHREFESLLAQDPKLATGYLYDMGVGCGYIHPESLSDNPHWMTATPYGDLEITINTAKPEKDPRDIAKALERESLESTASERTGTAAPKCDLCRENEGWPGSPEYPAKPGLRIGPIRLGGEPWGFQYSPYGYFSEHCIALSGEHRPMSIDASTVARLLDFADLFPFYFIGSNADIPIVGGSILNHDHFQGGSHNFPLMDAPIKIPLDFPYPSVEGGIVRWPASVIRLVSADRTALEAQAASIIDGWKAYSDPENGILAYTGEVRHNSLNPILHIECGATDRRICREGPNDGPKEPCTDNPSCRYVLDLILRNNRTDDDHPWGIFHPGEDLHHLKKENIGLIEMMGLAILPPRLIESLAGVQRLIEQGIREGWPASELHARIAEDPAASAHADWAAGIFGRIERDDVRVEDAIKQAVGQSFAEILDSTAVFPDSKEGEQAFLEFLASVGIRKAHHGKQ